MRRRMDGKPEYTLRQGQFLAFIHYYSKLNGCSPAEEDMVRYFKIATGSRYGLPRSQPSSTASRDAACNFR